MKLAYAEQSFTFTDFWLIRKIQDFISKAWPKTNQYCVKYFWRLSYMDKCITKHVGIKGQKDKSLWGVFDHHHWLWHFVKKVLIASVMANFLSIAKPNVSLERLLIGSSFLCVLATLLPNDLLSTFSSLFCKDIYQWMARQKGKKKKLGSPF